MYPRNSASPPRLAIGPVVQITDGAVQTAGVSVKVIPQGGTESAGAGTVAYSADGAVLYTPTQGETDYTAVVFVASKTGCIPATLTVVTSASNAAGYAGLDWGKITAATTTVALTGTTVSRVTLVDTTTENSDMRGTNGAALASEWTATRAAYLDGVLLSTNYNIREVSVTGSHHIAADIHELQDGVINSTHFAADWFTAAGLAASAVTEIQAGLATAGAVATLTAYVDTEVAAIKAVTDKVNTGLVADGAVWQFTVNMLENAPGGTGGTGDASQATLLQVQGTVNGIASSLSGVPITATGRIADGGTITLYCGDDLRVRSGTQLTLTVTDVGGSIYSRLNTIGTSNLTFGASRRGLPVSAISGSIASLTSVGSGASQTVQLVVEIDNAGGSLQPAEDYEWQVESEQAQGAEIDQLVEMAGILILRRRTV